MRRLPLSSIEPFLLWLIGTVALASLLPARGGWGSAVGHMADIAIALLFFLHGARLSRTAIAQGMRHWRLHLLVLAATFGLFPVVGMAIAAVGGGLIDPSLSTGLLFLALLPSTVQSSVAFTAMARGNVAAAVCSASLSNLVGIVVTPFMATILIGSGRPGEGVSLGSVETIALQLLLPFVAGHLLRPWIGGLIDRYKVLVQPIDRGSILLVVYSAFGAAVINGIWLRVGWSDLVGLLLLCALMLAVVVAANGLAARAAGLAREDAIVLLFCGSKKSLISGVPMAGALFAPTQVGMIVLPLMIFHQLQLFVCAVLAARYRAAGEAAAMPLTAEDATAVGTRVGLAIPEPCMAGVVANLALLDRHAETLRGETR
ncbi:bile acid:sodium symporter family protein [uncultured Sphingomonas sp.]|uniref:bile acid:sodium symporter family protein n=1 Tax=uncultured Sphingomonas sp. TaxID=158754 RepID=UPI0035CB8A01